MHVCPLISAQLLQLQSVCPPELVIDAEDRLLVTIEEAVTVGVEVR
jgi:hypothetical protein